MMIDDTIFAAIMKVLVWVVEVKLLILGFWRSF